MQMDNVWMTLHTALFLAHIEENELRKDTWNTEEAYSIDILYLIKKTIFTSLADLILSDINSGTKSYIKKESPEIFESLYAKAYDYFLEHNTPKSIREDFHATMMRQDKVLEDKIFLAAKKYVWYFEASTNGRVFSEIYDVPLWEMRKELDILSQRLESLKILRENDQYAKYIAHIYRLSYSMRWNQYKRNTPISVMSHKVIVAYSSYIIGMIGNDAGEENDILDMLLRAIYHDVPEVITWDIITPTKRAIPGFVQVLEKVEETMMNDYLFSYIQSEYRDFLSPYILRPFDGEQWKKVKYADIFSALVEAKIEDKLGNHFFWEKYRSILREFSKITHPGVEFLLKEMLLHFDSNKDESLL